jgi:2-polyprenyl-6-methoxyphenol hydroxylase-like FAD-dependent oxidoreductase
MNLGIQDAIAPAELLADVLAGSRADEDLMEYERTRRTAARRVIAPTDRMTRLATLRSPMVRPVRSAVIGALLRSPWRQTALARRIAQLDEPV